MNVIKYINKIADDVVIGEIDPITAAREFNQIKKAISSAQECIYEDLKNEVGKFSSTELTEQKIQVRKGGLAWDFKGIKSWSEKKSELLQIEEKAKLAYKSAVSNSVTIEDTGEVVELPDVTYKKDSIIFK